MDSEKCATSFGGKYPLKPAIGGGCWQQQAAVQGQEASRAVAVTVVAPRESHPPPPLAPLAAPLPPLPENLRVPPTDSTCKSTVRHNTKPHRKSQSDMRNAVPGRRYEISRPYLPYVSRVSIRAATVTLAQRCGGWLGPPATFWAGRSLFNRTYRSTKAL